MPMIPKTWQRFTCKNCEIQVDIHNPGSVFVPKDNRYCCPCGCPEPLDSIEVSRVAVNVGDMLIGSGPPGEAALDYLATIANALVDMRNMMDVKL